MQEGSTSPISEYLQSNYVASTIQKAHVLELLRKPKTDLEALDDIVLRLQSELEVIKDHKRRLDETIHAYDQLLTPFRRLPDDILRETFIWCLPENCNAAMDGQEPPLLLGRICRRWRSLAYSMPSLWATLHISSPCPPPESQCHSLSAWVPMEIQEKLSADFEQQLQLHSEAVRDWLNRSRSLPLSVSVELDADSLSTRYRHQRDVYYEILISFAHRWKNLEILIPNDSFLAIIQTEHLPLLEFLHIRFPSKRYHHPRLRDWTSGVISNAPKLHMLHLTRNSLRLSELGIDWTSLTHLVLCDSGSNKMSRLRRVGIDDAFTMLRGCKRLQRCMLEIVDGRDPFIYPPGEVSLPLLEALTIMDGALSLETLIECLNTPSLRDITYYTRSPPSTTWRSPLICLLRRNGHRIESLTTSLRFFTLADLVECFELVPSLFHLTGAYSWPGRSGSDQTRWRRAKMPFENKMMKTILGFLLPNRINGNRCLCPKLRTINLTESLGLTDKDALDFLQQRLDADGIERLTKVNIAFQGYMDVDLHAQLRRYVDEGLKIDFTAPPRWESSARPPISSVNPRSGLADWNASLPALW